MYLCVCVCVCVCVYVCVFESTHLQQGVSDQDHLLSSDRLACLTPSWRLDNLQPLKKISLKAIWGIWKWPSTWRYQLFNAAHTLSQKVVSLLYNMINPKFLFISTKPGRICLPRKIRFGVSTVERMTWNLCHKRDFNVTDNKIWFFCTYSLLNEFSMNGDFTKGEDLEFRWWKINSNVSSPDWLWTVIYLLCPIFRPARS